MSCAERTAGGGPASPPPFSFRKLVQRIREEFEYFPGLRLTVCEGARFWALDPDVCQRVLAELRAAGVLLLDSNNRYLSAT
jgi:hypothetical protein